MLKNKMILLTALFCMAISPTFAENLTLSDLTAPKPPAYRVGLSEVPEKEYIQAIEQPTAGIVEKYANLDNSQTGDTTDMTYADLSIKRLSREVAQELEYEEKDMVADMSLLWQGAATQSDTINFALYKLANPDADKPDEKSIKKVLTTIASMSTLVGASMGNPIMAGSALIGGNIMGIMGQDTKALNYKYTKVNDADMIILIRKVEDLQQKAIDLYYDYISAKKQLEFANELVKERQTKFELAQKNNAARELIVITDAYYRAALDKQRSAKAEFFSKRAALEQFVGNETFLQFEAELAARESGETLVKEPQNEIIEEEYNTTIENVENYTQSLSKGTIPPEKTTEDKSIIKPEFLGNNETENDPVAIRHYDYSDSGIETTLPEEGGYYSDFATGFAVEMSLDEFFNPEKPAKVKKEKVKKEKTPKEKIKKEKAPKVKEEKQKEPKTDKVKKEKPVKEKVKKEKAPKIKEKPVEDKTVSETENTEDTIKPKKNKKEKIKKEKVKKEKKIKEVSEEKPKEEKPKKEKKEKDPYPELHGQKPIHTYPRNSTKDLIFLHGRDKHGIKKPSDGGTNAVPEKPVKAKKGEKTPETQVQEQPKTETTVTTKSDIKPVGAESYNIPQNVTTNDFIPLLGAPTKPAYVQPPNEFNLPPLDAIRVPDLNHGGYSIHSEY